VSPAEIPEDFPFATDEFLSVRIGGQGGTSERFLLVGRPADGEVRVREWDAASYNGVGADYQVDTSALLADIESFYRAGVAVMPEMYAIRLWLSGLS
jgi:hypothetical protein